MNVMTYQGQVEIITIGLGPSEMLLESIEEAIKKHGIRNGVVVSGIGTLKTCRMHYIIHTDFPPEDAIFALEQPLELLSVSGIIADGEPHLHGVVSCADKEAQGGHIEHGCEVAYLVEIVIYRFDALEMKRHFDVERGIRLLGAK